MHLSASMHCVLTKLTKHATFFLNQRITAMLTVSTQKLNAFILKVNFVAHNIYAEIETKCHVVNVSLLTSALFKVTRLVSKVM